ncbi:MAG TPA: cyclic nucleotide-binding domain-containing protein, partial [Methylocystis sp.]
MPRDEQTTAGAEDAVLEQGFQTAKVLKDIVASLAPIELRPGDILMRQGEVSDAAYFLESGSVLVYAETPYGPVSLATLEGPRLVGEIGAFADLERTASVKAVGAARVFRIGRAPLLELGRKSPELLMSVVRQLGQQIDSVNKAVALYTNALAALEKREFDEAILSDLAAPSPRLAEFAGAFRRFAGQILGKRRQQDEMAAAAMIQKSFL